MSNLLPLNVGGCAPSLGTASYLQSRSQVLTGMLRSLSWQALRRVTDVRLDSAIREGSSRLDHASDIPVLEDDALALLRLSKHNIHHSTS
jgi:hypothetical protein